MKLPRASKGQCLGSMILALTLLCSVSLPAQDKKKTAPAPPPKAAAPAKPASSSRPAGATGSSVSHGSSTAGATHTGPTANGSHSGPTANGTHTGPTTGYSTSHAGPTANGANVASSGEHATRTSTANITAPRGSQQAQLKNGSMVQKRADGRVSYVHDTQRGMDIHRGLNGSKRVSVERPDHSRIVAERGRPGYVERGFRYNGHDYMRRSYYYHGREYSRYYRGYYYRGAYVRVYAPGYYYAPAFYGWAYNPWYQPVYYPWGWAGSPWYGYYGAYFAPYPVYPSAAFWLTDYIISTNLAAAYQAQQEAQTQEAAPLASDGAAPLTPEVKQMISTEVKNQLALENSEAQQNAQNQEADPESSSVARMLEDGQPHVFVAGNTLDVVDAAGAECEISDSDALELTAPPPSGATAVNLMVLSSKGGKECRKSDTVTVAVTDLQDMQNHMRATIDQGLQELQTNQGKNGLPSLPASASAAPVEVAMVKDAPPPDPNGAALVNQQLADSDQAEKDVIGQTQQESAGPSTIPSAPAAPTVNIELGQTIDQVTANLGPPVAKADLGAKQIYTYKDMKIIFKDGKVSDVQ
ncbi:MAG TPA: hypothetical protein VE178_05875 [Silvibacterium sp.]|nr:hypothetical protein [Silvibacterium sp.]